MDATLWFCRTKPHVKADLDSQIKRMLYHILFSLRIGSHVLFQVGQEQKDTNKFPAYTSFLFSQLFKYLQNDEDFAGAGVAVADLR